MWGGAGRKKGQKQSFSSQELCLGPWSGTGQGESQGTPTGGRVPGATRDSASSKAAVESGQ